ncbi:MAG: aminotransferase class I/II-fold pyridoxal phosphate-dependent enzyme [Byssovorax sp.]
MPRLDPLRHLAGELAALKESGLLRTPPVPEPEGAGLLNLCSNDYLGYASEPWPGAVTGRSGAGASRLVSGNLAAHESAEAALASWLGTEAALLFSSGYAANVGTMAALAGRGDVVVSDALNHASIIDGCRLSGAEVRVVPHLDLAAMEAALAGASHARRRWVVTESYFSMDGDSPDLVRLRALCDRHDAGLILDEAHVLGVLGPHGRGLSAEAGITPDVLIGTAGKSLGLHGAFVAGSQALRLWLWNRARSFVFSTGVSPTLATALASRIERVAADDEARAQLEARGAQLRAGLALLGVPGVASGRGPVLPWVVGASEATVALSRRLRDQGVLVQAIRPPTVPTGTARLRITVHARLSSEDVERALAAFHATR